MWAAGAALTLAVSRFALTAVLARRLSASEFGQFAYGQWLIDLAFLICSLGATGVVGRYLAEFQYDPSRMSALVRRWLPYAIVLPVLAGGVALFGAWIAGLDLGAFAVAALLVWAVANGLWAMQTAALTGLQRFDLIFAANAIAGTLMVAGALTVPLGMHGPGGAFATMAVSVGVATLVGLRQTYRVRCVTPAQMASNQVHAVRRYALNVWVTTLMASLLWSRGELPIVHAHLGDDAVARYAAVMTLFGGAVQGVMLAVSGVGPHLARLWGEGATSRALVLGRQIMDLQLLACGVAAVTMICLGPELLLVAFGSTYQVESGALAVLSVGILAMSTSSQSHLLQIATHARFNRNTTLLGTGVLFLLATIMIAALGLIGAAIARSSTMLAIAAASLVSVRVRWGSVTWSGRNVIATSTIVGCCALLVLKQGEMDWILRATLACCATMLIAVAIRDDTGKLQVIEMAVRSWRSLTATRPHAGGAPRP